MCVIYMLELRELREDKSLWKGTQKKCRHIGRVGRFTKYNTQLHSSAHAVLACWSHYGSTSPSNLYSGHSYPLNEAQNFLELYAPSGLFRWGATQPTHTEQKAISSA